MQTLIIIPTYNELDNIQKIVPAVLALDKQFSILVVDDGSPDGTANAVKVLQPVYPKHLHLLERTSKDGLGRAYIAGFKWALAHHYDAIVEMDADFSHQPRYLPDLIKALQNGADVALGSRYVAGGGTRNWSWLRKLISRTGSWYARTVLGLPLRDITGGFKAFKRRVLETIVLDEVGANGFAFQVEMNYRCYLAGFKITECPIIFIDREVGESKMGMNIIFEALLMVLKLRLQKKNLVAKGNKVIT
jgi:dolichol-phosphate mannosyltransferase